MRGILASLIIPVFMATGCAKLHREAVPLAAGTACPKQDATRWVSAARDFGPRVETAKLECALTALRAAVPASIDSRLQGSRLCLLLATRDADPSKREKLAAEGVRFAEQAIANGGDGNGEVHYYLAANLGFVVRDQITLAMENMPTLKREMERALALSPDVDDGGPLRLLGMLYLKAPAWPAGFGDGDKALELLQEAVRKFPDHPLNRLFLGQAIHEVVGEEGAERARSEWAIGLQRLQQGNWGYNREPWMREFEQVRHELDGSGS